MNTHMSPDKKRCLFLFTELAGYILACMKELAARGDVEVHVVRWPVNAVAPFKFSLEGENFHCYERKELDDDQLLLFAKQLQPDIIFCSGWIDKGYLKVCREFKGKVKTVLTFDNPWRNTIRQNIAAIVGHFFVKRYYTHCWVSGDPQRVYARKLGFKDTLIEDGFYSCDYNLFHKLYLEFRAAKAAHFPKRILFVGRYTRLKGVRELWQAFVKFQEQTPSEWELWCLGKGELDPEFPVHPKIKNFGFVQPGELRKFIAETGIFILPAHYEHWGVVVHEYAASGFPLICSSTTSAATTFLRDGENGFVHEPYSVEALIEVFKKLNLTSSERLVSMGDRSAALAAAITPDTWITTVKNYLSN
jgi:glycosyltransferase involved in cell wall biosynthesis